MCTNLFPEGVTDECPDPGPLHSLPTTSQSVTFLELKGRLWGWAAQFPSPALPLAAMERGASYRSSEAPVCEALQVEIPGREQHTWAHLHALALGHHFPPPAPSQQTTLEQC